MVVILTHVITGDHIPLHQNRTGYGDRHIPADIFDLLHHQSRLKHQLHRLGVAGNRKALEGGPGGRMLGIIAACSVAECGFSDFSVPPHRRVHAAAGDIVHLSGPVAHPDQGVHQVRLSVLHQRHHAQGVDAGGIQPVHSRVLNDLALHQDAAGFHAVPVEPCGIHLLRPCDPADTVTAEIIHGLCEYRSVFAQKRLKRIRVRLVQVQIVPAHKIGKQGPKFQLVLKAVPPFRPVDPAYQVQIVIHGHKGAALGLAANIGKPKHMIVEIPDSIPENTPHHVKKDADGGPSALLVYLPDMHFHTVQAGAPNTVRQYA